jgi:hypothetical protein
MREIYKGGVTPQQKLVAVNNKFGNNSVKSQQGTSRIIYDSLLAPAGTTVWRFYEDSSSRTFPFTNTGSDGNKLGVGDTMVIQSVQFVHFDVEDTTGEISAYTNILGQGYGIGLFSIEIANNRVVKKVTLTEGSPEYNKNTSVNASDLELETQIVIPPLLPYIVELQLPRDLGFVPIGFKRYIQCHIIGTAGIIAPRTTF